MQVDKIMNQTDLAATLLGQLGLEMCIRDSPYSIGNLVLCGLATGRTAVYGPDADVYKRQQGPPIGSGNHEIEGDRCDSHHDTCE